MSPPTNNMVLFGNRTGHYNTAQNVKTHNRTTLSRLNYG